MKILNKIPREFLINGAVALIFSLISFFAAYNLAARKMPKMAVVDLTYLNNDFIIKLSRYLTENKLEDEEVQKIVKTHLDTLEALLKEISTQGNYILLQKQTVVSENIQDITKDLEKALFESVIHQNKLKVKNEEVK